MASGLERANAEIDLETLTQENNIPKLGLPNLSLA
jgi:hypothetical protein